MSASSSAQPVSRRGEDLDVIILGGGLSGLSALKSLVESMTSYDKIMLFEAQKRVGGRVCTYEQNGVRLDKGASWIGPTQTRMYSLLNEFNIKTSAQYDSGNNVIFFSGTGNFSEHFSLALITLSALSLLLLSLRTSLTILAVNTLLAVVYFVYLQDRKVRRIQKAFKGTIPPISPRLLLNFAIAQIKLDYFASYINLDDPFSSPRASEFDSLSLLAWAEKQFGGLRSESLALKVFETAIDVIFGCDMAEISLLHMLFYIKSAGNLDFLLNIRGGAQQDRIEGGSSRLPLAMAAKFTDRITLNQPATLIDNNASEKGGAIIVHFADGQIRTCKRLILAIPPSVIAATIRFTNLPNEKLSMLKAMKHGQLVKLFAVFKQPYWRRLGYSGMVISPNEQPCLVYDVSSEANGVLLGFSILPHAPFLKELVVKDMREVFFKNYLKKLLPAGEAEFDEQYLFYADENFAGDPYLQGCPVNVFGVGAWKKYGKMWRQPINNLFWAATETSSIWNGLMEGAVRSGERAAAEVISSFKE